ncbi:MAG: hypothetical protein A4E28_01645 [Methanocella sp. PtaU1.Bin125]|nr:MAG: hypothetical protein A4E28_01645 [Methanocella sp. PtaU1.Bin125]
MLFRVRTLDSADVRKIGGGCGIAAIATYVSGTIVAAAQYPVQFSPFDLLISDLGNYLHNPSGAVYINAGGVIAGLLLVPFFVSIGPWYDLAKSRKFFYIGAELFGIVLALGMIMQAIFSQDTPLHRPWSAIALLSMLLMLLFANFALLKNPAFNRLIGCFGFAATLACAAFLALYAIGLSPFILEWIAVYACLLWVWLLSFNALSLKRSGS